VKSGIFGSSLSQRLKKKKNTIFQKTKNYYFRDLSRKNSLEKKSVFVSVVASRLCSIVSQVFINF